MTNVFANWVSKVTVALLFGVAMGAFGAEFRGVRVDDSKGAFLRFFGQDLPTPKYSVEENVITLRFPSTKMDSELAPKVELTSPHLLLSRAVFIDSDGSVLGKLFINGSRDGLRERIQVTKEGKEPQLRVALPKGSNPTLALLKDEQVPLGEGAEATEVRASSSIGWGSTVVVLLLLGLGAGGSLFAYRVLSRRAGKTGSRKFLVENMSYCPLGHQGKAGVALVRVGDEFVLVGVTPNQVTLLSDVPRVASEYREETRFESETFKEAVAEEYSRLRGGKEATA